MPAPLPQSSPNTIHHFDSKKKALIIVVLSLILFTHIMDFMVIMPLGPQLMRLFNINPHQFSMLVSVYSFSAGIFGLFGTFVFDRIDRKVALIAAYLGFLLGTLACALSTSYEFFILSRSLSGAFGGVLNAICFAIVGDVFSISERGHATGRLMASFSLAAIMGVPSGLILANHFGWHAPFISIVLVGVVVILLAAQFIPNVIPPSNKRIESVFSGITENFSDRNARLALITTFAMIFSQFVVIPFISPYLVANTGFPEVKLPWVYFVGGCLTVFTGPWIGRMCDRYGARSVFIKTGLLFLFPVFFITRLGASPMEVTLIITSFFFVLSNSRMVPAMTIISASIPPSRRGSFMSLNSCLQQLGSASASFIGGWVVTQSAATSEFIGFSNTAILAVIFGIIAYFFGQKVKMIS